MRRRILRRLDVLEKEERSRKLRRQALLATISFFYWKILLAYYVGGLKPDDEDPSEAEAISLNYESRDAYLEALFKGEKTEINKRFKNAARHLFAKVGVDFDRSPPSVLFESFLRMVNQLPEPWLSWLRSNLREECRGGPIDASSNIAFEFLCLQQKSRPAADGTRP
jgi:hypothetical protein